MTVADVPVQSTNGTLAEVHTLIEDLFSLAGKTAVVVGGGGVLAGEMAMGFAGAGAKVVIADLNEEHAREHARAICDQGGKCVVCQADVSKKPDIQRVLETTLANFGSVDVLLNAAGINSGTPFFDIEEAEWSRILDVDLRSVFLACQVIHPPMVYGQGRIHHSIFFGVVRSSPVSGIHLFGGQGRRESDHQIPGPRKRAPCRRVQTPFTGLLSSGTKS